MCPLQYVQGYHTFDKDKIPYISQVILCKNNICSPSKEH